MKILRYLMMAILVVGISGVAHASGFSWNLQDPDLTSFPTALPGVPFAFDFASCDRTIGGTTYLGCANIGNGSTTEKLTSFEFTFEDTTGILNGAPPACVSDSFAVLTCNLVGDEYVLAFQCDPNDPSCGIAPGSSVTVLESAVDGPSFPDVNGVANFTPEPSSIWLALSGMGSLGYLVRRRRRASSR
jgi:hypothetical protein